jgi:hypothetical protein
LLVSQHEALSWRYAERREVHVEKGGRAVPGRRVLVAGNDPLRPLGLGQLGEAEVEIHKEMAGSVLHDRFPERPNVSLLERFPVEFTVEFGQIGRDEALLSRPS